MAHTSLPLKLEARHKCMVLATDGLWEFVSNQSVCDRVREFDDPLSASKALLTEAYSLWLQFEVATDDITIIVAYIDTPEGAAPREPPEAEVEMFDAASSVAMERASTDWISA